MPYVKTYLAHVFKVFLTRAAEQVVPQRFLNRQIQNRLQDVLFHDLRMRIRVTLLEKQAKDPKGRYRRETR